MYQRSSPLDVKFRLPGDSSQPRFQGPQCQHPHFAGSLDSQVPSRMNTLEDLVSSGLLSELGSGNGWPRPHPSEGTLEEVPSLGGVN